MLTNKQQAFVDEYLIDMNGTQSAIRAGYSEKTANEQAARLLANVSIKAELDIRLKAAQKRRQETLDDILNELDENRLAALTAETVQSSAATTATMAKAKLLGYVIDKQEVTGKGGAPFQHNLTMIDPKSLTTEQLRVISSIPINSK